MDLIQNQRAVLLLVCQDKPGIVASFSSLISQAGGNIVDLDQHTDFESGIFFMRLEWALGDRFEAKQFQTQLNILQKKFQIQYRICYCHQLTKVALFVSKYEHCLYDLLVRHHLKEFQAQIELIISNHPDLKKIADHFAIPYVHLPVDSANKTEVEKQQLELLKKHQIDLIILARYMQVLSPNFVAQYPQQIINIHHSFLPAFIGAKPYHQAYERGVKLIGATSHYVTEKIDEGPIIHQSVTRISHRDRLEDLIRKGRDQEKVALAYAVKMHLEHRILTYHNKTVVFE